MFVKQAGVVLAATLSALGAGGLVMQLGAHALALPVRAATPPQNAILKSPDGHYWATAEVNGAAVRFLVDTGSSVVTLTPADAERLGLDTARLTYDRPVYTAAGDQQGASVTLDHIAVAGARVDHVKAIVMRAGLPASLLGMSYLGRLSRIEATPERLVLSR
jgi:aspartyl protease family protein